MKLLLTAKGWEFHPNFLQCQILPDKQNLCYLPFSSVQNKPSAFTLPIWNCSRNWSLNADCDLLFLPQIRQHIPKTMLFPLQISRAWITTPSTRPVEKSETYYIWRVCFDTLPKGQFYPFIFRSQVTKWNKSQSWILEEKKKYLVRVF